MTGGEAALAKWLRRGNGGKGRPANQAENAGNPGTSNSPKAADTTKCSDPVDVVSGHVVDEETDFTLPARSH